MGEKCELRANGLELKLFGSRAEPFLGLDRPKVYAALAQNLSKSAYAVAWLDHKVIIGLWNGTDFEFYESEGLDLRNVQRLRVFDHLQEMHIWRSNGQWKGRLRVDREGEDTEVVVAHQLLFGTKGERLTSRYARIREDRGTELLLPLQDLRFAYKDALKERVFIKTHNYIKPNAVHQATYFDCRFVAFTNGRDELS